MEDIEEIKFKELVNKVESILFSAGKKVSLEEIKRLTRKSDDEVKHAAAFLKEKYDHADSSLMLVEEGDSFKLTVREKYLNLVQRIVFETELPKTVIETLAAIAYKAPVLQSDVIKIRTNKAYDHVRLLEEDGYITRSKQGRTMLIKLTDKFYNYFDLPPDKVHELFHNFKEVERIIQEKEKEIEEKKAAIKDKEEELKKQKETEYSKIGKLDVYGEGPEEISKEKLGDLEVVDETAETAREEEKPKEVVEYPRTVSQELVIGANEKEPNVTEKKVTKKLLKKIKKVDDDDRIQALMEKRRQEIEKEDQELQEKEKKAEEWSEETEPTAEKIAKDILEKDEELPEPIQKRVDKRVHEIMGEPETAEDETTEKNDEETEEDTEENDENSGNDTEEVENDETVEEENNDEKK